MRVPYAALAALSSLISVSATAQVIVSVQDGKQVLENGHQVVPNPAPPDTVAVIHLSADGALRISGTQKVAGSIIGPPSSVAITPDGKRALVTAARKIDTEHRDRIIAYDLVTVLDLKPEIPRVIGQLHAGAGASGIVINRAGTLALVANRAEGTVSVFGIAPGQVSLLSTVTIGPASSSPAQPVFFDNDRRALVSRDGDHLISVLDIDGTKVSVRPETISPGLRPYGLTTAGPGDFAVSANIGGHARDMDTISLIDLRGQVPHVVDIVAVGLTPEGIAMSPHGDFVAVNVNNGSDNPPDSEFYHSGGVLQIWRIAGGRLHKVTEAPVGHWGQGVVWLPDGSGLLVQDAVEQRLEKFSFDGTALRKGATLGLPGTPAAIAISASSGTGDGFAWNTKRTKDGRR